MNKKKINDSFTIEDIHQIRYKNYENTKNLSTDERLRLINHEGLEVQKEIERLKGTSKN